MIPGTIEPHAALLGRPPDEQLLYKVTSFENLLKSIDGSYLHFNRVDRYDDFPNADPNDGLQLPSDREDNASAHWQSDPDSTGADYYDRFRSRSYACCFSLENSPYIWREYGGESLRSKACVVFSFGKLRATLSRTARPDTARLLHKGMMLHQMFDFNCGEVRYVPFATHRASLGRLPTPIIYNYLKDERFEEEKELRITLTAQGYGHYYELPEFPPSIHVQFDWRAAMNDKTAIGLMLDPSADHSAIMMQLRNRRILPRGLGLEK